MQTNAMDETFQEITVLGKPALFCGGRIDRHTVPVGLYAYDVRHDDDQQGIPCQIAKYIMVNHWGTILCKSPFPLNEYGSYYPENSMNYLGTTVSLQDWMNMSEVDFKEQQATENTMTMGGMG